MQNILLFVKHPEPGRVKTRLEPLLGKEDVARLYCCFVLDLLETLAGTGYPLGVFYDPPEKKEALVSLFGEGCEYRPQEGADLGERMKNAFKSAFAEGMASVVLIGSDLPDLPGPVLREAFSLLEMTDGVLGPSVDGGYYLVGFRKEGFFPDVFNGISWSTDSVFSETMRRFSAAGRTVALLPRGRDLDRPEDLRDFRRRNLATPFARSHTMIFLEQFDFFD
ncbi:MAG: 2-phospho-L-lactate guanylyltransferase [Syntrophus sp. PtaU1.Bin208]|nr:MAG: 2-phospho-L-lactate guanylyltransferase [Syntrophus sp. PtaU1.Bin208]